MSKTHTRVLAMKYIGEIPEGAALTPELIAEMIERAPREEFDIELAANKPGEIPSLQHHPSTKE